MDTERAKQIEAEIPRMYENFRIFNMSNVHPWNIQRKQRAWRYLQAQIAALVDELKALRAVKPLEEQWI